MVTSYLSFERHSVLELASWVLLRLRDETEHRSAAYLRVSRRRSFCYGLGTIGNLRSESASGEMSFVLIKSYESVASDAFYVLHFEAYVSVAEASSSSRLVHSLKRPWAWHLFNLGFSTTPIHMGWLIQSWSQPTYFMNSRIRHALDPFQVAHFAA